MAHASRTPSSRTERRLTRSPRFIRRSGAHQKWIQRRVSGRHTECISGASHERNTDMQIRDNVFVVTGAGSGLGAATAKMIVERGGKVALADVNPDTGETIAAQLGPNARFVATDVASEPSAKAVFA